MRLGVAAVLVLGDPEIERVAGHKRLDAAVAGGAAIIERQVAIDDVRDEVGASHGETAHGVGLDVVLVFVEVVGAAEAVAELVGAVEDRTDIVDEVHQVRRRGAGEQQCRARARIHDPVHGVDGDREQRALLPFEDMALRIGVEPNLGGAAPFDHEVDFLVEVPFRIEGARARHLDHVAAPFAFGAVELDVGAASAEPLPGRER
jgi:hypothetical protein